MREFVKNLMNPDLYQFINNNLISVLTKHVEEVMDDELLDNQTSDIEDILIDIQKNAPGEHIDIQWSVKPLVAKEVIIPRLIYWRVKKDQGKEPIGLSDLMIPIGQGYNDNQELNLFFLTLDSTFTTVNERDFFIPIPLYNTIFEVKEDFNKIFEYIKPTHEKERLLLATSYFHQFVNENGLEYLKAFEPGLYRLSPIEYRYNFGYITNPKEIPIQLDIDNFNIKELYRQDKIKVTIDSEEKELIISEVNHLLRKSGDDYLMTVNGIDIINNRSLIVSEEGIYRKRYTDKQYEYQEFDSEMLTRRHFGEFNAYTFNSEKEAIKALKNNEIHRYEISNKSGKPIGVKILDLFGFDNWFEEQMK